MSTGSSMTGESTEPSMTQGNTGGPTSAPGASSSAAGPTSAPGGSSSAPGDITDGWKKVRHVPQGETWHPVNDNLKGTALPYGDPSDDSQPWSLQWNLLD